MQSTRTLVLHIDDDIEFASVLQERLRPLGYDTVPLHDPTMTEAHLQTGKYRLVLLDNDMPYISGQELLPRMKSYDGGLPVIMVTDLISLANAMELQQLGAEACFFKPVADLARLTAALDQAVAKLDCWWTSLEELKELRAAAELSRV
ncbi:MAG: response regulator [Pirellulales bacterium]|nr:response regulator [Pirellulales bacterium]